MARGYRRFRLGIWIGRALPLPATLWLAERVADACSLLCVEARRRAGRWQRRAGGAGSERTQVRQMFRHFARYLVEWLLADRIERVMRVEDLDRLGQVVSPGRSAILLTGHVGNWELGAAWLARHGWPVTVVALPHADPRLTALYEDQRRRFGVRVVSLNAEAGKHCLQALRAGGLVGLVGDRDFGEGGVVVPFLGAPTALPRGPAVLSCRADAPVVPMFLVREGSWRFRFIVEPPIAPRDAAGRLRSIEELTGAYAQVLERCIKRFPDQWIMF